MAGRATPPLFELLRDQGGPVRVSPTRAAAGAPSSRGSNARWRTGSGIMLSWNVAAGAAAIVLIVLVAAWVSAYSLGRARERGEWERMGLTDRPLAQDPGASSRPPAKPEDPAGTPANGPAPDGPLLTGPQVLGSKGQLVADPRETGQNYLKLAASVPSTEAAAVLAFLEAEGVPAIGVPVDPARRDAKNEARYDLYTLMGVSGNEFRSRARERDEHREHLTELGDRWRREHRGTLDFARSHWDKHEG